MHDPLWMRAFLAVHITAGAGAFLLAPLALVTAKGGKAHRTWGAIYFWCMTVVAVTALVMALYLPILFLALVAVFSFYSAFVAYRVLGQKAAWKGEAVVRPLDWIAAVICFVSSAALALLGVIRPELVQHLRRHGYSVDDCGGDLFAVHKKSPLSKLARDWAFRARG